MPVTAPGAVGVLSIAEGEDGALILGITGTPEGGAPRRRAKENIAAVNGDQFVRILVNARHTTHDDQYYSEIAFNVARGSPVPVDRFL